VERVVGPRHCGAGADKSPLHLVCHGGPELPVHKRWDAVLILQPTAAARHRQVQSQQREQGVDGTSRCPVGPAAPHLLLHNAQPTHSTARSYVLKTYRPSG
jgi:hypothetical protein